MGETTLQHRIHQADIRVLEHRKQFIVASKNGTCMPGIDPEFEMWLKNWFDHFLNADKI